jgi:hypothetical protein
LEFYQHCEAADTAKPKSDTAKRPVFRDLTALSDPQKFAKGEGLDGTRYSIARRVDRRRGLAGQFVQSICVLVFFRVIRVFRG